MGSTFDFVLARKKGFRHAKGQTDAPSQNGPDHPQIAGIGEYIDEKQKAIDDAIGSEVFEEGGFFFAFFLVSISFYIAPFVCKS